MLSDLRLGRFAGRHRTNGRIHWIGVSTDALLIPSIGKRATSEHRRKSDSAYIQWVDRGLREKTRRGTCEEPFGDRRLRALFFVLNTLQDFLRLEPAAIIQKLDLVHVLPRKMQIVARSPG